MVTKVTAHFNKDISKLRDRKLILSVRKALQKLEAVRSLSEIPNLKRMEGTVNYFRVRIGDYRMGIYVEGNIIYAARFLHRKEIYRYFP